MKKKVNHCGGSIEIEIKPNEKVGFICDYCEKSFEVNYNGDIS